MTAKDRTALVQSINADLARVTVVAQFAQAASQAKFDAAGAAADTSLAMPALVPVDTAMYRAATVELVARRAKDDAQATFDVARHRLSLMALAIYIHADVATPQDPSNGGAINRAGLLAILLHHEQDLYKTAKHQLDDANHRLADAKADADRLVSTRAEAILGIDPAAVGTPPPASDVTTATTTPPILISKRGSGPSIVGPVVLNADEMAAWFASTKQPAHLTVPMPELASDYVGVGLLDNVRADIAFAQSVLETGYFDFPAGGQLTPADNNFAGIGACDSCTHGWTFPDAQTGVAAQLQLLHQYASRVAGVGPLPGLVSVAGCCPTWMGLSGVWATGPDYGYYILSIYRQMLEWAVSRRANAAGL